MIYFDNTLTLKNSYAVNNGGGLYINSSEIIVSMNTETTIYNVKSSNSNGGVFYILKAKLLEITGATVSVISAGLSGSFIYAEDIVFSLVIKQSTL